MHLHSVTLRGDLPRKFHFFLKLVNHNFFLFHKIYELRDNKTNVFMPTVTMVTKILTPTVILEVLH